jgi:hypothetical protein
MRSYRWYAAGVIVSDSPTDAKAALIEKIGSLPETTLTF